MSAAETTEERVKQLEDEIKILTKEKEKAQLEKDKAEAEKARLAAIRATELESLTKAKEKADLEKLAAESEKNRDLESLRKEKERLEIQKLKAEAERKLNLEASTQEKEKAELEKAKAEADRAALTAMIPKSDLKALEGKITIDDNLTIEAHILSYEAAIMISSQIASEVRSIAATKSIVIYNDADIASIANSHAILSEIDYLLKQFGAIGYSPSLSLGVIPPLLIPELAAGAIRSIGDVIALFRTDRELKGKAYAIDEVAIVANIAKGLGNDVRLIYPKIFSPGLVSSPNTKAILNMISQLTEVRRGVASDIIAYEQKPENERTNAPIHLKIPRLKALAEQHDKLMAQMMAEDDKTGTNGLSQLLKSNYLLQALQDGYLLYLKPLAAGGYNMTTRNLFTGSSLKHSGGSIIVYLLFDSNGSIKSSGTLYYYSGNKDTESLSKNF